MESSCIFTVITQYLEIVEVACIYIFKICYLSLLLISKILYVTVFIFNI